MTVKKSAPKPAKKAAKRKPTVKQVRDASQIAGKTVREINKQLRSMGLQVINAATRDKALGINSKLADLNQREKKKHGGARPNSGGHRKGAGRKPGSTTKKTKEIADKLVESGDLTPLEYMLQVLKEGPAELRRQFEEGAMDQTEYSIRLQEHIKRRDNMAEKAAPYIHPRLASIQAKVETDEQAKWLALIEAVESNDG